MGWRLLGVAIVLGAYGVHEPLTAQAPGAAPVAAANVASGPIHQEVDLPAGPRKIFDALLNGREFAAFSGRPATVRREVGTAFSLFGGHIIGRNLEVVPDRRIVQAWRVVTWPEGVYSIVRFELRGQNGGTHIVFDHVGFPEAERDHLAAGWESNYWALLRKNVK